jgi:hypothetical protein
MAATSSHERHRHRYEFNNNYLERYSSKAGLVISGFDRDDGLVEIVELPGHPWFLATQFHPEFTSTPRDGHPLFTGFVARPRARLAAAGEPRAHEAVRDFEVGLDQPFFLIAGPCVIESERSRRSRSPEQLKEITARDSACPTSSRPRFDKANRSSGDELPRSRPRSRG